jgi:CzcA family heavy metal efflux pump
MMNALIKEYKCIPAYALHHKKSIIFIILGLCLLGLYSLYSLPSGIYPDVAFPRIAVIAERGEDSVENMLIGVTKPMEEAINAVPGLTRVRSRTIRGGSELSLDFSEDTDMTEALSQTRARISTLLPDLPSGLTTTIEQQTPSVFPVISFNVTLDASKATGLIRDGADLDLWAKNDLKPRLSRLTDVYMVTVQGSQTSQIIVEPDPRRLAESNLSIVDLTNSIGEANVVGAVGVLERDYRQYQLLASSELTSIDDINSLPVVTRSGKTIHVRDVAKVYRGLADRNSSVTGNLQEAVVVSLFMRFNGKVTSLSDLVQETIDEITPKLPPGVSITPVYNQAELVRESLGGVRDAIVIGMILAILVLWAFLSSWRVTLVAGISIPLSVIITFALMSALGQSLNLMSLGGIAVAIGLIIDDAIVVVENVARHFMLSKERLRSVIEGTREIIGAVVGSSLTTVVVFIPLIYLEGIEGQFFRAMATTLTVGILVSMIVSLTLIPIISSGEKLGPHPDEKTTRKWMEYIAAFYERYIRIMLMRPWKTAGAIIAIALIGILLIMNQSTGFLPSMDEGGFVLDYDMPVGTSLSETDKNCRKIEEILTQIPEVRSYSRRTGMELGFFVTEQYTGDFLVSLKPLKERDRSTNEVVDEVRQRILKEVPQISVSFVQIIQDTLNDLSGSSAPLEVKIFGNDYRIIQDLSANAIKIMEEVAGVVDIEPGVSYGSPEIIYEINADAVSQAGLTSQEVENQLRTALLGEEATKLRRNNYLIPVVVRYADSMRKNPIWVSQIPIANSAGRTIPASLVSRIKEAINVNELSRENQQPLVSVQANISGRDLGSIAKELNAKLGKLELPSGVRVELGGEITSQKKAFRNMMMVAAFAIGLVFLLLVIQFRSYRLPLVIFFTVPFSQIGALLALRLTGTELNISAFMGLIMLVGLVVKNGIILIEYTAQLRDQGIETLSEALAVAGRTRLRPVLMTSMTAIIALLPLALNIGSGAELQRPLAIAVIGGLSISTLFTLVVIPVAHLLVDEPEHRRSNQIEEEKSC